MKPLRRTFPYSDFGAILLMVGVGFFCFKSVYAQQIPDLQGKVIDAETGVPLPGVNLVLEGISEYAVSDETGRFVFSFLPVGIYRLKATHIAYRTSIITVSVVGRDAPAFVELRLTPRNISLPEVVVDAESQPSQGFLSGGTVISRETILKSPATDLADLLEKQGLVDITSDGTPGGPRTVSLRGSAANQVLVLLDGRPLNTAADGTADLSLISPAEVQRLEVYSQAPAGLGAQAIGGVINIITVKPGEKNLQTRFAASQYGERWASFSISRPTGLGAFTGVFEHRESDGRYRYRVCPDDGLETYTRYVGETFYRENAAYQRDAVILKFAPAPTLNFGCRLSRLDRQNPDYLPEPILDHRSTTDNLESEIFGDFSGGDKWYQPALHLQVKGYNNQSLTDYEGQYPLLNDESVLAGEVYSLQMDWRRRLPPWDEVDYGAGVRWERVWSSQLQNTYADRWHRFAYLQAQGNLLKDLNLPFRTGVFSGVRADLYSEQSAFVHPRLGVEISGGKRLSWKVRGELAGSYRLPSFNSLFWQEDLQAEGNPELKPERSADRELSLRFGSGYWNFDVTYFDRRVWDLIYWRLDFDDRWKPLNIARARITGTELRLRGKTPEGNYQAEFTLSYRWMRAVNQSGEPNTDGKQLIYRPEHSAAAAWRQELKWIYFDLSIRWVGERFTTEANTKSLAPYQRWDAAVGKRLNLTHTGARVDVRFEARNIFDSTYRIIESAPTPLREFWFSLVLEIR